MIYAQSKYICHTCKTPVKVDVHRTESNVFWKHEFGKTDHKPIPVLKEKYV